MKSKKGLVLITVVAMAMGMLIGCSNGNKENLENAKTTNTTETAKKTETTNTTESSKKTESESDNKENNQSLSGTKISFLNSKGEIQTALEEMAEEFEKETGINVEIIPCGTGESPFTKITSMYNSGTAPTLAMLDGADIVALAKEYALDLSNEDWIKECENQVMKVDGKVYSFPFCVEGRGLIYNKKAIEDTLGTAFDPTSINTYDSLKNLLENLRAAGMENPVVISKEDWSLGAHQLGYIYDTYDGTTEGSAELINKLKDGSQKVEDYERFNQFLDTMELLLQYNINGSDPLGALYEQDPIFLADGDAAIWANGVWAWPNIAEAGAAVDDEYGFIPFILGNDPTDFANTGIEAASTKHVMIDATNASETEIASAKEFLNWIVYADNGQRMLIENAGVIPACSNNSYKPLDPLGKDIQAKLISGNTYSSCFVAPSDHWSVLGASMQKFIAGKSSRVELAKEINNYWAVQK